MKVPSFWSFSMADTLSPPEESAVDQDPWGSHSVAFRFRLRHARQQSYSGGMPQLDMMVLFPIAMPRTAG